MNEEQLRKKIQHSLNEGYTEGELRKVLKQQGFSQQQINKAFRNAKRQETREQKRKRQRPDQGSQHNRRNEGQTSQESRGGLQGNSQAESRQNGAQKDRQQASQNDQGFGEISDSSFSQDDQQFGDQREGQASQKPQGQSAVDNRPSGGGAVSGVDLTGSEYTIKQKLLLRRYSVYANDEKVLKAKKKFFSIKTKIPFELPEEGEEVFRAESERLLNISHNYELKDKSGENLAIIDRKRTLFNQVWRVRDPEDNGIAAEIKTASQATMAIRIIGSRIPLLGMLTALIPHTYRIEDNNGQEIGELAGEFSIRDKYDLKLQDSGNLDREAMIAAVIAIDALEGQ